MSGPSNEWEREQRQAEWKSYRDEAKPRSSFAAPLCSPAWHRRPTTEAWWWDGVNKQWVDIGSSDFGTMIVSDEFDGWWWGPIYPPETPENEKGQR